MRTEIDVNECEHFFKANLDRSKLDRCCSANGPLQHATMNFIGMEWFWKMENSADQISSDQSRKINETSLLWKKNSQWNKFKPFKTLLTIGIIEK